jgi:hypothetical protein
MGWMRNAYRSLLGKPEGKRPLAKPRCRWEDNIKIYLRGIRWEDVNWINLAWDRNNWRPVVNMVMNVSFLANFLTS